MVISVATLMNYGLIMFGRIKGYIRQLPQQRMPSGTTCYEPCTRLSSARKLTCPHFPYLMLHYLNGTFSHLASIMMDKPAKPLSAKHKNYCQCSKRKCTKNCSCAAAGVNCIVSCKCTANKRLCARIAEDSEDDE